jgi:hypothetical protein
MPEKAVVHNKQVTKDLNALEQAFWENVERQDDCEYGSIGLDCKRPFGNSYVQGDILEIIGKKPKNEDEGFTDEDCQYADYLYTNLADFMRAKYLKKKRKK